MKLENIALQGAAQLAVKRTAFTPQLSRIESLKDESVNSTTLDDVENAFWVAFSSFDSTASGVNKGNIIGDFIVFMSETSF